MPKKIVKVVTVTGADDSIRPEDLIPIAQEFPFVEFGVLLSKKQQGRNRFPSEEWLDKLAALKLVQKENLTLSGHICGRWVKELCLGETNFFEDFGPTWGMFNRFQLNFHAEPHPVDQKKLAGIIRQCFALRPVIFQLDDVNDNLFYAMLWQARSILSLFDVSHGAGILPKSWPRQVDQYCGYAGGLSPDNLAGEMERIVRVTIGQIWIDAETRLRSDNDKLFDLAKVRRFLAAAKPWVIGA